MSSPLPGAHGLLASRAPRRAQPVARLPAAVPLTNEGAVFGVLWDSGPQRGWLALTCGSKVVFMLKRSWAALQRTPAPSPYLGERHV